MVPYGITGPERVNFKGIKTLGSIVNFIWTVKKRLLEIIYVVNTPTSTDSRPPPLHFHVCVDSASNEEMNID